MVRYDRATCCSTHDSILPRYRVTPALTTGRKLRLLNGVNRQTAGQSRSAYLGFFLLLGLCGALVHDVVTRAHSCRHLLHLLLGELLVRSFHELFQVVEKQDTIETQFVMEALFAVELPSLLVIACFNLA